MKSLRKVIVVIGPTASGKTKYAIEKAKLCNGEIINCDSLQVYKDLKILTAFPTKEELSEVNHKLFGYLNYDQKISAVDWAKSAAIEIETTLDLGKVPIIVGGTGLYINTLMQGISPIPNVSEKNRNIANEMAFDNFDEICENLYKLDSELRNLFPKEKHRQLIRAFEVFLETGKSIRHFRDLPKTKFIEDIDFDINIVNCEREVLYEKINLRFDLMLKSGAIEEVESLLKKIDISDRKLLFNKFSIFNAIGAKEITGYLDGEYSFDEMKDISKTNSRHYAKRQVTWFKNQI